MLNSKKRIVLFGGSFDPITFAHLSVISHLSENFDRVILLPCFISPFKQDANIISSKTRIKLLREVIKGYTNVSISLFETKKKKTSFSYLSILHFKKKYKNLYFCIGSDGLDSLDRWAMRDIITKNAIFYVVERPFFPIKEEDVINAKALGFNIELANFMGKEGSSSLVRLAVAFSKLNNISPIPVEKYILENGLYTDYKYITDRYDEFHIKESRREHIYRTAKTGIILAKKNNVDVDRVIKALLFHDIGKYVSPQELLDKNIEVNDEYKQMPECIQHGCTSESIARHYFNEKDEEILCAVRNHSSGRADMSMLEKIVFLSDYIEEGRDFEGLDRIRKIVYQDIDKGMVAVLENTIKFLKNNNMDIYYKTIQAYDFYKEKVWL